MQSLLNHSAVEPFLVALVLLVGFAIARARGGKEKLLNLAVVCAFMAGGLLLGLGLGVSVRNSIIGSYAGSALMWAWGSIAAVGRIRKNRRFARIYATGVAY
jgi:hypothetical protein